MAGELYKALSRNQNLEPAIDNIRNAVRERQKREVMNRLVDTMRNVDNMSATPSLNYEPDPMQRYKNAGNLVNKALFDEIAAGADPSMLQNVSGAMMNKVNMMKPEDQNFFQADPYKELYLGKNLVRGAKDKPIKVIPFNQTKEGIDYKYQKDLEKIGAQGKEARKTAGYKASFDKQKSDKKFNLDISSLRANAEQGIAEIQNAPNSAKNYKFDPVDNVYKHATDPQAINLYPEDYNKMIDNEKKANRSKMLKYYNDATEMLYKYDQKTNRDLSSAKNELEKIVNGDASQISDVLQTFKKDNPDVTDQELEVLRINLIYEAMAK